MCCQSVFFVAVVKSHKTARATAVVDRLSRFPGTKLAWLDLTLKSKIMKRNILA